MPLPLESQDLDVRGQASAVLGGNDAPDPQLRTSLRYILSLFLIVPVGETPTLDSELALNLFGSASVAREQRPVTERSLELYRGWVRYATPDFELRAGLQKISFGSATLFRPLMWFDSLDPRDPLQITDGVYALLGKYYFLSTGNLWLWGIYGRDELKGWETIPTKEASVEFGGRLQMPVLTGEAAITYHHRTPQLSATLPAVPVPVQQTSSFPEDRLGFDGKWDAGPGVWVESAVIHQNTETISYPWQQSATLGMDYTFRVGGGLTVIGEFFVQSYTSQAIGAGPTAQLAGVSASYLMGLLDNVSGIFYYDLRNSDPYTYLDWRRTYDNWVFDLILFADPDQPGFTAALQQSLALAGKGFAFVATFNH
jgi:hypothetical protein